MNFQDALTTLQEGKKLTRACWKDKTKYVFIYQPTELKMLEYKVGHLYRNTKCRVANYNPTSQRWTPIENDLFATDWELVK